MVFFSGWGVLYSLQSFAKTWGIEQSCNIWLGLGWGRKQRYQMVDAARSNFGGARTRPFRHDWPFNAG